MFFRIPRHPLAFRRAAFTLIEVMVASGLSVILASVIYTIGSEALLSFARNISINRSYSDARIALERMAQTIGTAGHTPVLINSDGLTVATITASAPRAAGIRFYRSDSSSVYLIASGVSSSDTKLKITVPAGSDSPQVSDLMAIGSIGFEGIVTATDATATYSTSSRTVTLSFTGATLASQCYPTLSTVTSLSTASTLQFTRVAFVAVGTQLRYYPRAAADATAFSTAANYKVVANLVANPTDSTQQLPFAPGFSPTINIRICAEGPDYNNRKLGTANTFTQLQTCLGPRSPLLLRSSTSIVF